MNPGELAPERSPEFAPDPSPDLAPELSIVVCSYNRAASLGACLDTLLAQTLPVSRYEIVVVDNASTDTTAEVIAGFAARCGHVRRVWEPQPGKSRAANAGMRASRGTWIAFTDDDVLMPADWAERVVADFRREGETPVAVAGPVASLFEVPPPVWLADWLGGDLERRLERSAGFLGAGRDLYLSCGANTAYEKRALLEVGGFSEEWGPVAGNMRCGGEDTELIARLGAAYPRVWFDPSLCIEHRETAATMRMGYRAWRKYLEGVAVSRLEGTVLCSRRTAANAWALARRLLGNESREPAEVDLNTVSLAAASPSSRLVGLFLRSAVVAGRIRGARLF